MPGFDSTLALDAIVAKLQGLSPAPTVYVGVPDYLKILLDKAAEAGKDASSIKRALVSGGALFPSLRAEYAKRGVAVHQAYAIADVGNIAYESPGPDGAVEGMIVDEGVIVEIVRPGTGDPVPEGEVGEVVVTGFNRDYPMIRLATGDLSAVLPGRSSSQRRPLSHDAGYGMNSPPCLSQSGVFACQPSASRMPQSSSSEGEISANAFCAAFFATFRG